LKKNFVREFTYKNEDILIKDILWKKL